MLPEEFWSLLWGVPAGWVGAADCAVVGCGPDDDRASGATGAVREGEDEDVVPPVLTVRVPSAVVGDGDVADTPALPGAVTDEAVSSAGGSCLVESWG